VAYVVITPRDPVVFRDGRPFNPDGFNLARTWPWPFPSTLAGALRTVLGRIAAPDGQDPFESEESVAVLKAVKVSGAFMLANGKVHFPRPADAVGRAVSPEEIAVESLTPRPLDPGEGCDWPDYLQHADLWPVAPQSPGKPEELPDFWSFDRVIEWLTGRARDWRLSKKDCSKQGFIYSVPTEERVHVSIDRARGTVAGEGSLFVTKGLAFPDGWSMVLWVEPPAGPLEDALRRLSGVYPLGGERRLARFEVLDGDDALAVAQALGRSAPEPVKRELADAGGLRMLLVTPVPFASGWLPGWLDPGSWEGSPPGFEGSVRLRLRGARLDRWVAMSGWSLENWTSRDGRVVRRPGPKPVRRLVPQGAVYFFEIASGHAEALAEQGWLVSVADEPQDRADGFGLVVWGSWAVRP
jgi:CRISPR-associated protein Cmr3